MKNKPITKTIIIPLILISLITISGANIMTSFGTIQTNIILLQETPTTNIPFDKDDCKHGEWLNFTNLLGETFTNQGACISFVATEMCKSDGWTILKRNETDIVGFSNQEECVDYFKGDEDE